jgi:hypothetical protein
MQKAKRRVLALAGLLTLSSLSLNLQSAQAQDLLQRLQSRRAAREEANSPPQAQSVPAQQSNTVNSLPPSDVAMVTLQTQLGPDGQQMVLTPKGYVVPLPGSGVNGSAVQIFMGSGGGYWYVDKNNQQVDLTAAVQRLQGHAAQSSAPAQAPQYAPPPQTYAQPVNTGATAAAAAGLGAMAGAAIAGSNGNWNTIPYGSPVRYGAGAVPYYNQGGKAVYINNSNTANINDVNGYHAAAINQQQNWYRQQQLAQGENYKTWQQPVANPFVAEGSMAAVYGANQGQEAARYGAAAGATAAHYGAAEGQQAARYGAAAGVGAAHYGAEEGQQAARMGAAEGAGAAHYGEQQGQQAARMGAAEGAGAAHRGAEEGQQAARMGAAEGARAGGADRENRFAGRGRGRRGR